MKRRPPHEGVYARIGPSRVHGVGVRAIRDIPAGTYVFRGESERVVWMSRARVRRMPAAVRALYEDFGMVSGERIGVPPSLNMLSVGWYLNHSDRPNVEADDDGRFFALRRIRAGEELTADYRTFVDEPLPFRPRRARASRSKPRTRQTERA
jgi:SET domain-containing protein